MFIKTRPGFWKDLWALLKPYWFAQDKDTLSFFGFKFRVSEKVIGRTLLITIIVLTLGLVYINVQFNYWYNDFYNTLQDKKQAEFFHQLGKFGVLATAYILVAVYAFYLNQMLQIRWRRWLTDRYLQEWLSQRTYYRMQLTGKQTDNPDQRISEDMKVLVDDSLDLSLGFLNASVTLVSFVSILWGLSGALTIPLGGKSFEIPGYMVWVAVVYAIVGTWLTHKLGKPLITLNFNQQRFEADFRFNLVRFRENTEGVALYRGEPGELRRLPRALQPRRGQLVGADAATEDPQLLHHRLQPDRGHLPVSGRRATLLLGRHPARRSDPDLPHVRTGAGRAFLVHRRLQHVCQVEGDRRPSHRLPHRGHDHAGAAARDPRRGCRGGRGQRARARPGRPGTAHRPHPAVQGRRRHLGRRAGTGAGALGFRQEHAVPCHRRNLAFRRRPCAPAEEFPRPVPAAAAVLPARHAARSSELSGRARCVQ